MHPKFIWRWLWLRLPVRRKIGSIYLFDEPLIPASPCQEADFSVEERMTGVTIALAASRSWSPRRQRPPTDRGAATYAGLGV